jgi:acetyl esterase
MASLQTTIETAILRAALGLPERVQRALLRRPVVIDGQRLAAETQMMLKLQALTRQPGLAMLPDLHANRAQVVTQGAMVAGHQEIGALRELSVDGGEGPIPARLYIPTSRLRDHAVPTLLFIHGGGHGLGTVDSHDGACRFLAERSGVQVLSIEYRLAPEHPFPAAVDDCFAAFQWLGKNAGSLNADPDRLAVGGDSAGGNLAAATALQAAEAGLPLAFQLLIYPVTDFVNRSRSRELFDGGGFFLERPGMDRLLHWYLPEGTDPAHPLASMLLRSELPKGLAPAFVATAGFDPLRDEGEAYAQLLAEHGVQVELERYPAMIHGFFNIVGAGRECRANAAGIADRLRAGLGG